MENENLPSAESVTPSRCPYLGLHDDSRTSLAYPSAWNYCYRAHPPASVSTAHQDKVCLTPEYIHCPVYLAAHDGPLPSNLRGSSTLPARGYKLAGSKLKRLAWFLLFFVVLVLAAFWGQRFFPVDLGSVFYLNGGPSSPEAQQATVTLSAGWTRTIPARTAIESAIQPPVSTEAVAPATAIPVPSGIKTPMPAASLTMPVFTPIPGMCGYSLDSPFGTDVKFVLHRVMSGENLDMYARQHQTTTDAIRAVNYFLPLPVWENWIVVIPVGVSDVKGIPSFEPYQADGTITTLDELARQLGVNAQSLGKYNTFDDSCTLFIGWLLVPRDPTIP